MIHAAHPSYLTETNYSPWKAMRLCVCMRLNAVLHALAPSFFHVSRRLVLSL